MRCAVFGGVLSTKVLIEGLVRHGFTDVHVWGYEPEDSTRVSGWVDLRRASLAAGYQYSAFRRVSDCERALSILGPDLVFVVGLSQLFPESMLSLAKVANVGFHPTALPKGRGRAPIAWLILEQVNGAATFFALREGADDGPIFVQIPFEVAPHDDAAAVYQKVLIAEAAALDQWLPVLKTGDFRATEQDHSNASWLGRRDPSDGLVNWSSNRQHIIRLVRATAPPHPGAFSYCGDIRINILSVVEENRDEKGVVGRILAIYADSSFDVQAGDGLIHVASWASDSGWLPRVGMKLGYDCETEVHELRKQVRLLEEDLTSLKALIQSLGRPA